MDMRETFMNQLIAGWAAMGLLLGAASQAPAGEKGGKKVAPVLQFKMQSLNGKKPAEAFDAIVAYVKTIPPAAAAPPPRKTRSDAGAD